MTAQSSWWLVLAQWLANGRVGTGYPEGLGGRRSPSALATDLARNPKRATKASSFPNLVVWPSEVLETTRPTILERPTG